MNFKDFRHFKMLYSNDLRASLTIHEKITTSEDIARGFSPITLLKSQCTNTFLKITSQKHSIFTHELFRLLDYNIIILFPSFVYCQVAFREM